MAGGLRRGDTPLIWWQIDYIGPLPMSEGAQYALTCMCTTMGIMQAYPSKMANQQAKTVCAFYVLPEVIESDQGTHFTGH